PDGPLKVELLKSLPYVPPSIWDDLHPSGRGSGKLRAALGADKKLDYLIEVVPKEAALTVPAADATLTGATGSIKFRDAKLTLENCKAHFAGGTVGAGGVWDFNPPQSPTGEKLASAGEVKVTADGLDSKDVPASWGLN